MSQQLRERLIGRTTDGRQYAKPTWTDLDPDPLDHVAAPSGGLTQDGSARTAINGLRDLLVAAGLMKES